MQVQKTFAENTPIDNAYVSGLSGDLNFHGNQLAKLQMIFVVGSVLGLSPFTYLFPEVLMRWLVPSLDLGWGLFTLRRYRGQSFAELMALSIYGLYI
jgi:hypothetical protein